MINFTNVSYWPEIAPPLTAYLKNDNWDDYHFKTLFELLVIDANGERHELGGVKIMSEGMQPGRTLIPSAFQELSENYCSLGQSQDYYEKLLALPEPLRKSILIGLRDCVANESIWSRFQNEKAMSTSLLRVVDEFSAKHTYKNILLGIAAPTAYEFRFITSSKQNFEDKLSLDFSVTPGSMPPSNVHVLIGRNGVGKTRLLSGLSAALTSTENTNDAAMQGSVEFQQNYIYSPYPPGKFANLVTIAFSAFDKFSPIHNEKISGDMRYSYVGLRKPSSDPRSQGYLKSQHEINEEFAHSLLQSLNGPRHSRWIQVVRTLNADPGFAELELQELNPTNKEQLGHAVARFDTLSSGHRLVLLTAAKLVELVDERTLVLMDEPESHLHPPLLGSLMRALSGLLSTRNGVAIVATHSPVVLQEVPKSCVSILRRTGNIITAERPTIQTFAENVSVLTREVFQLEVTESGYHKLLRDAAIQSDYTSVIEAFGDQIGSEGRAIVRALTIKNRISN